MRGASFYCIAFLFSCLTTVAQTEELESHEFVDSSTEEVSNEPNKDPAVDQSWIEYKVRKHPFSF